jgi:putative addiction module killer protein|tara:strand:+ start:9046 stop:9345 length:300 start_codon:yes stop_codon:yes gene_type:complete
LQYSIKKTDFFDKWLRKLKDTQAKIQILNRIARIESEGYFGDYKEITEELSELRFFAGPGYRVYFTEKDGQIVILLAGGDKSSQQRDIKKAKILLNDLL